MTTTTNHTDGPFRLELSAWDRDALLFNCDTAAERLALIPELIERADRTAENNRLEALLREEDDMLARWAAEREAEAADA